MIYICNSFSLAMLPAWRWEPDKDEQAPGVIWTPEENWQAPGAVIEVDLVSAPVTWLAAAEARHGPAVSAVGHADTAAVFAALLDRPVPVNRISVSLTEDDELLIGQLTGPRLPEGSTTLPEGAAITWLRVVVQ